LESLQRLDSVCYVFEDVCDPDPCQNGAACLPDFGNEAICICTERFTGELCEIESKALLYVIS